MKTSSTNLVSRSCRPWMLLLILGLPLASLHGSEQVYSVLHHFNGTDGRNPIGTLLLSGSTLYGTTSRGGSGSLPGGTVFKINTDGTGFAVLHSFDRPSEGESPRAGLALLGITLYGTTYEGGVSNRGTVFRINIDGSGFAVLTNLFDDRGSFPVGTLVVSGDVLYGTTSSGGGSGFRGTVFGMNTDGSGYTVLAKCAESTAGGPGAGVVLSGSTLYGTSRGGADIYGHGYIFRVNTDGTGFTIIKQFSPFDEGGVPSGLALSDEFLYYQAGGSVFGMNVDGSGYRKIGGYGSQYASPVASGTNLYCTHGGNGVQGMGLVYRLSTDGSGYTSLRLFSGLDGNNPYGGLAWSGRALYGTTYSGGASNYGVVFSLSFLEIMRQPLSQIAAIGSAATLGVLAEGEPPLGYQWFFNHTNILTQAINSSLPLTNLQPSHSGAYTVIVSNSFGVVTSRPAMLTVVPPFYQVVTNTTEAALKSALAQGGNVSFADDGTFVLTSPIEIANQTVLDAGTHQVTISGSNNTPVFYVYPFVEFKIANLVIANGRTTNGAGVYNDHGVVKATNCTFVGNFAIGLNSTGDLPEDIGAAGAAVYNAGTFNATACTFRNNLTCGGVGWRGPNMLAGDARGGAICNLGLLSVDRSLFASNSACGGLGGHGLEAGGFWTGPGGPGGDGGGSQGGAVFNGGNATLINCTVIGNLDSGGTGGQGGNGGYNIDWGTGQIYYYEGGWGGAGGHGSGALFDSTGALHLTNCTIAFNSSTGGLGGAGGWGEPVGLTGQDGTAAGAIETTNGVALNTILAANSPANATGFIADGGHNLSSDSSCSFTNAGSVNNTDPRLARLAINGGPTLTLALLPGSPAIDAADTTSSPPVDQRGFVRPIGVAPDIGAYEFGWPAYLRVSIAPAGGVDILLSSFRNSSWTLFTSTNINVWTPLGTQVIGANGTLLFHEDPPLPPNRYYRTMQQQ